MQSGSNGNHLVLHLMPVIAKLSGENIPVFDAGQDMFNDNADLRNCSVLGLLLLG